MKGFLLDNLLLIAIILVCLFGLLRPVISRRRYGPMVDNQGAVTLINRRDAQIIDVRPRDEWRQESLARSVSMPADEVQNAIGTLDKKRPILLVDADGRRAPTVARLLRGTGFSEVYILAGGLASWRKAGLPFSR